MMILSVEYLDNNGAVESRHGPFPVRFSPKGTMVVNKKKQYKVRNWTDYFSLVSASEQVYPWKIGLPDSNGVYVYEKSVRVSMDQALVVHIRKVLETHLDSRSRDAEVRRREDMRWHYASSAKSQHSKCIGRFHDNFDTEHEVLEAAKDLFQAQQALALVQAQALERWPVDLNQVCLGDSGVMGEIAIMVRNAGL